MSEHLGVANITVAIASFKSIGQFLKFFKGKREPKMRSIVIMHNHNEKPYRLQDQ